MPNHPVSNIRVKIIFLKISEEKGERGREKEEREIGERDKGKRRKGRGREREIGSLLNPVRQ